MRERDTIMMRNSIRSRLITFLLMAIIPPIVASIFISYQYTKHSLRTDAIRENSNIMFQGKTNIMSYINLMNNISLYSYNNIQNNNSLYNALDSGQDDLPTDKNVYAALHTIAQSAHEIEQVYLHSIKSNHSYLMIDGFIKHGEGDSGLQNHFIPPANKVDPYIEPSHPAQNYGMYNFPFSPTNAVVSIHRYIYKAPLKDKIGVLSIDFRLDSIQNICDLLYAKGNEEAFLINADGSVIYASQPDLIGRRLQDGWVNHVKNLKANNGYFDWNEKDFHGITLYEKIPVYDQNWFLVKQIPNSFLYKNALQLIRMNSLVIIFFLIVVIVATLYISVKFTLPIKQLTQSIKNMKIRHLKLDIDSTTTDEIGLLTKAVKNMVETIDNLVMQELRLEISNKDNQLKALQAQINPHFIYNTLQSIGAVALQNNVPKIYSLTSSLGDMMRYNMNTYESVVPLSKELKHIQAYFELQKQRFKQKINIHVEVDPDLEDIQVPKMILQPIVENCFKHGFEKSVETGVLELSIKQADDNFIKISILDNGLGITPERLDQIQKQIITPPLYPSSQEDSIGLINVISRVQLFFNNQARFEIDNKQPRGFAFIFWLPTFREGGGLNEGIDRG
jgi:two-component system sensor histidine kinase YesM